MCYNHLEVPNQARLLLVWIILAGSISLAQPQTRFIDAVPPEGDARAALLASAAPAGEGIILAQSGAAFGVPRPAAVPIAPRARAIEPRPTRRGDPAAPPPLSGPFAEVGRGARPPAPAASMALVVPIPVRVPAAYRRTFRILSEHPELTDRYDELILRYSRLNGLKPRLVKSIIAAESEFDPGALSPRGARGLMQVVPPTAAEMGASPRRLSDPEENIRAGTAYLALLYRTARRKFGFGGTPASAAPIWVDQRVIAAFHAGPRYLAASRWLPSTRAYARKVLLFYQSRITEVRRAPEPRSGLTEFATAPADLLF